MNRKPIIVSFIALLLSFAATVGAAECSMPVDRERVEETMAVYDPDLSVSEEAPWLDGQKVYSLTDGDGNKIAYLSSVGEGAEGILYFLLLHTDESSSKLYQDDYSAAVKAAAKLFDDSLDADRLYDDFRNTYGGQSENCYQWNGTYNETEIEIQKSDSGSVDLTIALYNSEEYSPILEEGDPGDYTQENPLLQISEISYAQYCEAAEAQEKSADESLADGSGYRFYKIEISDSDYHREYEIDLELFVKFDISTESEKAGYEYVVQNHASAGYTFSGITGYCRRVGDKAEAVFGIPIVKRVAEGETQYKESFHYLISYTFSLDDPENAEISTMR